MKYIYIVSNGMVKAITQVPDENIQVVIRDRLPIAEHKPCCTPILKYSEEKGVFWDYIPNENS